MTKDVKEWKTVDLRLERMFRLTQQLTDRFRDLLNEYEEELLDDIHDKLLELQKHHRGVGTNPKI